MNNILKSGLFLALFTITFSTFGQQTIKEKHLASYVMDCVDYWFYPNHTHPQLDGLAQSIVSEILHSQNYEYEWNWSALIYEAVYPLDYVGQIMRGAIIQHVSEHSYHYAREITSRENARRIADYIYNYLFNYCSQNPILPQGIFAGCVADNLRNWVIQIYNQSTLQYAPERPCCW